MKKIFDAHNIEDVENFSIGDIILTKNYGIKRGNAPESVVVLGSTGTGKSRFLLLPNLLNQKDSFVIVDPSGEMLKGTGTLMQKRGYRVRVVDFTGRNRYNFYNPLQYCKSIKDVVNLADIIREETSGNTKSDAFWCNAEKRLWQAIIGLMVFKPQGSKVPFCKMSEVMGETLYPAALPTISDILKLSALQWTSDCGIPLPKSLDGYKEEEEFDQGDKVYKRYVLKGYNQLDVIFENVKEYNTGDEKFWFWDCWEKFKIVTEKTASAVYMSAAVNVDVFSVPGIKETLSADNVDLETFGDGSHKDALYIVTPIADMHLSHLTKMLVQQIMDIKMERQEACAFKENHHLTIYYDEAANVGLPAGIVERMAVMHKYRIELFTFFQSITQIKAILKDKWQVFIANNDTIMFLGSPSDETCEFISKMAGKTTVQPQPFKKHKHVLSPFSSKEKYQSNTVIIARDLISTNELLRMSSDECVVLRRGHEAIRDTKYNPDVHPDVAKNGHVNKEYEFDSSMIYGVEPKKA
jgi:type IV secretion system protein VirD4